MNDNGLTFNLEDLHLHSQTGTRGRRRSREAKEKGYFWTLAKLGALMAIAVRFIWVPTFLYVGANALAVANIISVLLYATTFWAMQVRRNILAIMCVVLEVHVHCTFAVYTIGWDSGFHYYFLVFVPTMFAALQGTLSSKYIFLIVSWLLLAYMGLDAYAHHYGPQIVIDPWILNGLRWMNISLFGGVVAIGSFLYLQQLSHIQRKLQEMATTDVLTDLPNRRGMMDLLRHEMLKIKRQPHPPLSFVLADIDHFKHINDTYGHDVGDQVLKIVATRLDEALREQDSVARWGGEEFLMLMPGTSAQEAVAVAERLRLAVAMPIDLTEDFPGTPVDLTPRMTFGVTQAQPPDHLEHCLLRMDQALYDGKKAGRDRVVLLQG